MPPVIGIIGAIVGAVSTVVATVGAVLGIGAGLGGIVGMLAVTAGLKLIGKLLRGSTDPPPARGSVTDVSIDPNAPQPYAMGEGMIGGVARDDVGYGATLNDVPNPYRWIPVVHSGGGPVESITPWADQAAIDTSYYGGFMAVATQLGACPESAAMVPPLSSPAPDWGSSSKLSGQAATGWNFKFDRDGKVFASGTPQIAAYGKWVKVYDPRKDSTFPGGSGAHRLGNEATYEWSDNPALHAGTYAYGRWQNGKRTMGVGLPKSAIDWAVIAAWASVCNANHWKLFGVVSEGQADDQAIRWANLKDIAMAGGGIPAISGGILSFLYQAPRVSVVEITEADIADDDISVTAVRSYRDRINTVIPRYISPDHNWQYVTADPVANSTYVTDDGEVKQVEWPFNLVKHVDQAAQLARYVVEDARELQPIELTCLPHLRTLRPGELVDLYLPSAGVDCQAVILQREIDPATLKVKFICRSENPSKHTWALTATGTPPAAPGLALTGEERDEITWGGTRGVRPTEPIGGVAGGVTGGDVGGTIKPGGGVDAGQVDTAAIQPNSVSVPSGAFSPSIVSVNPFAGFQLVQTVSYTSTGTVVQVLLSFTYYSTNVSGTNFNVRIVRNGSVVWTSTIPSYAVGYQATAYTFQILDTPTAGLTTYDVEVEIVSGAALSVYDRSLTSLELKR